MPTPSGTFVFYERPALSSLIFVALIAVISLYVLVSTPINADNMIGFLLLGCCVMAIAWSPMQAYLSPLFTLNQQAFICHDLGRVIPWADIEKWEVHTIWIGARGNTMAFELTIVLQGKSRELLPCKYSRTRIESKLGYNAERNPKTLKNSRIPIQRTKIILRFERFPKDMDRNTLTSMLATYKPTYSKDS